MITLGARQISDMPTPRWNPCSSGTGPGDQIAGTGGWSRDPPIAVTSPSNSMKPVHSQPPTARSPRAVRNELAATNRK